MVTHVWSSRVVRVTRSSGGRVPSCSVILTTLKFEFVTERTDDGDEDTDGRGQAATPVAVRPRRGDAGRSQATYSKCDLRARARARARARGAESFMVETFGGWLAHFGARSVPERPFRPCVTKYI